MDLGTIFTVISVARDTEILNDLQTFTAAFTLKRFLKLFNCHYLAIAEIRFLAFWAFHEILNQSQTVKAISVKTI